MIAAVTLFTKRGNRRAGGPFGFRLVRRKSGTGNDLRFTCRPQCTRQTATRFSLLSPFRQSRSSIDRRSPFGELNLKRVQVVLENSQSLSNTATDRISLEFALTERLTHNGGSNGFTRKRYTFVCVHNESEKISYDLSDLVYTCRIRAAA